MRLAANDQQDKPPLFIDLATFGTSAEACANYLAEVRAIAATGRLVYRECEAEEGTRRSKHRVSGRVRFGGVAPTSSPPITRAPPMMRRTPSDPHAVSTGGVR
jgi:single-stranded DNA-binding protein